MRSLGASPRSTTASRAAAASDASPRAQRKRASRSAPDLLAASAIPRKVDRSARRSWSARVACPRGSSRAMRSPRTRRVTAAVRLSTRSNLKTVQGPRIRRPIRTTLSTVGSRQDAASRSEGVCCTYAHALPPRSRRTVRGGSARSAESGVRAPRPRVRAALFAGPGGDWGAPRNAGRGCEAADAPSRWRAQADWTRGGEARCARLLQAPEGRARWTLEPLAGEIVRLTDRGSISCETVRRRLKDDDLKPWQRKMRCIPAVDAEFVVRMEDVLYAERSDPRRPVVCWARQLRWPPISTLSYISSERTLEVGHDGCCNRHDLTRIRRCGCSPIAFVDSSCTCSCNWSSSTRYRHS
jgi:hypothetical protein